MGFLDRAKQAATKVMQAKAEDPAPVEAPPAATTEEKKKAIEDILHVLQIPETFEIPPDVLLPEDLKDVRFDAQVPSGYDVAQVTKFVTQTRTSLRYMVDLLRKRNNDVAKLATTIDRLQVDANNLRFENEVANGVSLIPTQGDADLENELMEAKLTIRRLEDRLASSGAGEGAPAGASEDNSALLDQISVLKRENADLAEQLLHFKSLVAHLEEAEAEDISLPPPPPLTESELEEFGIPVHRGEAADELVLPTIEVTPVTPGATRMIPPVNEEELISILEEEPEGSLEAWGDLDELSQDTLSEFSRASEPDEDDELDSMMREYK